MGTTSLGREAMTVQHDATITEQEMNQLTLQLEQIDNLTRLCERAVGSNAEILTALALIREKAVQQAQILTAAWERSAA